MPPESQSPLKIGIISPKDIFFPKISYPSANKLEYRAMVVNEGEGWMIANLMPLQTIISVPLWST